jgi:hypothetical protein
MLIQALTVRDVPALTKKSRYVVGRHLGHTDQLCFAMPGSEDLVVWFPRRIGCFRTPGSYNYVHGGLSLQELVVPHLQVTQQVMGRPVGVRAELPDAIRSVQFVVRLEPVASSVLDQPRQVTLSAKGGKTGHSAAQLRRQPGSPARDRRLFADGMRIGAGRRRLLGAARRRHRRGAGRAGCDQPGRSAVIRPARG